MSLFRFGGVCYLVAQMQILHNATIQQILSRVVVKNFTTFNFDNIQWTDPAPVDDPAL